MEPAARTSRSSYRYAALHLQGRGTCAGRILTCHQELFWLNVRGSYIDTRLIGTYLVMWSELTFRAEKGRAGLGRGFPQSSRQPAVQLVPHPRAVRAPVGACRGQQLAPRQTHFMLHQGELSLQLFIRDYIPLV